MPMIKIVPRRTMQLSWEHSKLWSNHIQNIARAKEILCDLYYWEEVGIKKTLHGLIHCERWPKNWISKCVHFSCIWGNIDVLLLCIESSRIRCECLIRRGAQLAFQGKHWSKHHGWRTFRNQRCGIYGAWFYCGHVALNWKYESSGGRCHTSGARFWRTFGWHCNTLQWPSYRYDAIHNLLWILLIAVFAIGYHATTPESFAESIHEALDLSPDAQLAMRQRAREWAINRFSEEEFEKGWDASEWKKCLPAIPTWKISYVII